MFDVRLDGETLSPDGKWTETCKHKERNCEYLEIDIPLIYVEPGDYRLQRSLLIDHKNKVLLLTDTVLADQDSHQDVPLKNNTALSYRSEFYISPKLHAKTSDEATEIEYRPAARSAAPVFRVLPLALPEWKSTQKHRALAPRLGSGMLTASDGTLILRQETAGRSLFAPLFFDLDTDRLGKRYTWRQLSVGENLKRVREDQAVGYRIQLGLEQFLLYRSLTPPVSRTVLGHNLIDDFCFARFDPKTGVEPLIAVEVTEE
jgi:hypothetical protein